MTIAFPKKNKVEAYKASYFGLVDFTGMLVNFKIPCSTLPDEYLMRIELYSLSGASHADGEHRSETCISVFMTAFCILSAVL